MVEKNDTSKQLTPEQKKAILAILEDRFEQHMHRHEEVTWSSVLKKLEADDEKLWSLNEMEVTGGEPDVIGYDHKENKYLFCDCSTESPKGRRSVCYDREALEARKKHKPETSAVDMAQAMGIELLTEEQYHTLQQLETVDTKTSSWIQTPADIRKRGGALFGDHRYGRTFVYHNGAESYYAARGFRCILKV
ncbi:DUF4256 domain-containing protein [Marinococcus halophilus]|uniref:DUF4256 domain-containing protein n=1 Tax=Marinococcus halophilus TaxID=1371 RepID=A0A510Y3R0_MARHA|nr:DUF4256 domain-containing protein [Marinococcus halophilus]OZT80916.1 DUF4256 domain-containing protein [Marinococcus halophilus]GEK57976.1 hypothetical protein MHA01_08810 [Marinococcus halophilus]